MASGVGILHEPSSGARRGAAWALIAILITVPTLIGGFLVKDRCVRDLRPGGPGWQGQQYSSNCYSDITALYGGRGFTRDNAVAYRDADLEYPALTGLFITVVNLPVRPVCSDGGLCGIAGFFTANVLALAPFGLLAAGMVASIVTRRWRILSYALAPAILAYAFHNWDLIPVGLTAAAMWAFAKRRDGLAGILLGLGAAAKLYPAFIVPVFIAARWDSEADPHFGLVLSRAFQDTRGTVGRAIRGVLHWMRAQLSQPRIRVLVCAAAGFLVPNLIVYLLAGFDGWWYPWQFQGKRPPNFETSWFFISRHLSPRYPGDFWTQTYPHVAQWTSTAIFLAAGALLLWREMRREQFRPFVTATGMVLLFLVTAKVFSPQYALWLLPFLVLAGIPWWGYGLFVVADLFVLGAIWWYLTVLQYPGQVGTPADVRCADFGPCASAERTRLNVLEAAVWFRYAILLLLLWVSRRAPELADHSEAGATTRAPLPA